MSPTRGAAAYSLVYTGLFGGLGAHMAFHGVWLAANGFSDAAIGWLTAAVIGLRIVSALSIPAWADRARAPRLAMTALALLMAFAAVAHPLLAGDAALVALAAATLGVGLGALIPITEAHAYLAAARDGFSYRLARSVGSAAFIAGAALGGVLVERAGVDAAMALIALLFVAAAAAARTAPVTTRAAAEPAARLRLLVRDRRLTTLLAAAALIQSSHAAFYAYGSIAWTAQGFSAGVVGALWGVGVAAEIALFMTARPLLARVPPAALLAAAGGVAALRWVAMAAEPGLAAAAALQLLHAGSFGLTHLATMEHIARTAPQGSAATAQGAAAALSGVAMVTATAAAAALYPALGPIAYLAGAAPATLGAALAFRRY